MLKRLGKDIAIYGSADLLFRATQFFAVPVYAYALSVSDFGRMALLTVTGTLLGMLVNLGINNSIQRFYFDPETPEDERSTLVSTGLAQLLLSALVASLIALTVLAAFGDRLHQAYAIPPALALIVIATILPEQLTQYIQDVARLQFAPFKFVLISLVRNLLGVLIGLLLLLQLDMGIAGILLGTLSGAVLALPLGLFLIRRDLRFRFDRALAEKAFRFGFPFVFTGAAYWVFGSMDRWMLVELSDETQVGLFSIGLKLAAVVSFVTFAFGRAWSPFAFKMYGEDPHYRRNFAQILIGWFAVLSLCGLIIALFAREVLQVLTPREYWAAAPVISIAVAGLVLEGTTLVTMIGISLERRTMLLTQSAWTAAATNVVLNWLLIPQFGAVGAALATLISYGVLTGSMLYWTQRLHPLPLDWPKLGFCLGVVVLSATAPLLFAQLSAPAAVVALKLGLIAAALAAAAAVGLFKTAPWKAMLVS
jgi:O-antigen/teichoic acid export membrane protein